MSQILLAACLRFADQVDRYTTSRDVILALDIAVRPTIRVYGVWPVPLRTQRGDRRRYPTYIHPDVEAFDRDFWPKFQVNGPSVLARYAWQFHRDFSLRDVVRLQKPKPHELWIFEWLHEHGMGDMKYIAIFRWWYGVFWSPKKSVHLTKLEWRALRLAAEAAAQRIEEIEGREELDPKLTDRERAVLRMLKDDRTEKQIGQMLKITPASVKAYLKRARRKLGTKTVRDTVAEAVRRYVLLGWGAASGGLCAWECFVSHWGY